MGTLHLLPPRPCSHALRLRLQNLAAFPAPTRPSACRSLAAVTPTRALAHVGTAASLSSPGIGHARCCLTLARAPRSDRSTWRRRFRKEAGAHAPTASPLHGSGVCGVRATEKTLSNLGTQPSAPPCSPRCLHLRSSSSPKRTIALDTADLPPPLGPPVDVALLISSSPSPPIFYCLLIKRRPLDKLEFMQWIT